MPFTTRILRKAPASTSNSTSKGPAPKALKLNLNYDSDDGLLPEIERITAPPGHKQSQVHDDDPDKWKGSANIPYCVVCREGGEVICCDICPATFHLQCHEPPILDEEEIADNWMCNRCANTPVEKRISDKKRSSEKESEKDRNAEVIRRVLASNAEKVEEETANAMAVLADAAVGTNTEFYTMPDWVAGPSVAVPGQKLDDPRPHIAGKICAYCQRYGADTEQMISCDFCQLVWHLNCLDPPMCYPPKEKWMCPDHVEHLVDRNLVKSASLSDRLQLWKQYAQQPVDPSAIERSFFKLLHGRRMQREVSNSSQQSSCASPSRKRSRVASNIKELYSKTSQASTSGLSSEPCPSIEPMVVASQSSKDLVVASILANGFNAQMTRARMVAEKTKESIKKDKETNAEITATTNAVDQTLSSNGGSINGAAESSEECSTAQVTDQDCIGLIDMCMARFACSSDPRDRIILQLASERIRQMNREVAIVGRRAGVSLKPADLQQQLNDYYRLRETRKVDTEECIRREMGHDYWDRAWPLEPKKAEPDDYDEEKQRPPKTQERRGRKKRGAARGAGRGARTASLAHEELATPEAPGPVASAENEPDVFSTEGVSAPLVTPARRGRGRGRGRGDGAARGGGRGRKPRGGRSRGGGASTAVTVTTTTPQENDASDSNLSPSASNPVLVAETKIKLTFSEGDPLAEFLVDKDKLVYETLHQRNLQALTEKPTSDADLTALRRKQLIDQMRAYAAVTDPHAVANASFMKHIESLGRLPDLRTQNNQNLCPKVNNGIFGADGTPVRNTPTTPNIGGGGPSESIDINCKVGGDSWAPGVASLLHDHVYSRLNVTFWRYVPNTPETGWALAHGREEELRSTPLIRSASTEGSVASSVDVTPYKTSVVPSAPKTPLLLPVGTTKNMAFSRPHSAAHGAYSHSSVTGQHSHSGTGTPSPVSKANERSTSVPHLPGLTPPTRILNPNGANIVVGRPGVLPSTSTTVTMVASPDTVSSSASLASTTQFLLANVSSSSIPSRDMVVFPRHVDGLPVVPPALAETSSTVYIGRIVSAATTAKTKQLSDGHDCGVRSVSECQTMPAIQQQEDSPSQQHGKCQNREPELSDTGRMGPAVPQRSNAHCDVPSNQPQNVPAPGSQSFSPIGHTIPGVAPLTAIPAPPTLAGIQPPADTPQQDVRVQCGATPHQNQGTTAFPLQYTYQDMTSPVCGEPYGTQLMHQVYTQGRPSPIPVPMLQKYYSTASPLTMQPHGSPAASQTNQYQTFSGPPMQTAYLASPQNSLYPGAPLQAVLLPSHGGAPIPIASSHPVPYPHNVYGDGRSDVQHQQGSSAVSEQAPTSEQRFNEPGHQDQTVAQDTPRLASEKSKALLEELKQFWIDPGVLSAVDSWTHNSEQGNSSTAVDRPVERIEGGRDAQWNQVGDVESSLPEVTGTSDVVRDISSITREPSNTKSASLFVEEATSGSMKGAVAGEPRASPSSVAVTPEMSYHLSQPSSQDQNFSTQCNVTCTTNSAAYLNLDVPVEECYANRKRQTSICLSASVASTSVRCDVSANVAPSKEDIPSSHVSSERGVSPLLSRSVPTTSTAESRTVKSDPDGEQRSVSSLVSRSVSTTSTEETPAVKSDPDEEEQREAEMETDGKMQSDRDVDTVMETPIKEEPADEEVMDVDGDSSSEDDVSFVVDQLVQAVEGNVQETDAVMETSPMRTVVSEDDLGESARITLKEVLKHRAQQARNAGKGVKRPREPDPTGETSEEVLSSYEISSMVDSILSSQARRSLTSKDDELREQQQLREGRLARERERRAEKRKVKKSTLTAQELSVPPTRWEIRRRVVHPLDGAPPYVSRWLTCPYDTRLFDMDRPIMALLHPEYGSCKPFAVQKRLTMIGTEIDCDVQLDGAVDDFCYGIAPRHADMVLDKNQRSFTLNVAIRERVTVNDQLIGCPLSEESECVCGRKERAMIKPTKKSVVLRDGDVIHIGCAVFLFKTYFR